MTLAGVLSNNDKPIDFIFGKIERELKAADERFFQCCIENITIRIGKVLGARDPQGHDIMNANREKIDVAPDVLLPGILRAFPFAVTDMFVNGVLTKEPAVAGFTENESMILTVFLEFPGAVVELDDSSIVFVFNDNISIFSPDLD
jgi:hypothetical protein